MKIEGLFEREELRGFLRTVARETERLSVSRSESAIYAADGWTLVRSGKHRDIYERPKQPLDELRSVAWKVLYDAGFPVMSGKSGIHLAEQFDCSAKIDVVAHDGEAVVVICCASNETEDIHSRIQDLVKSKNHIREALNRARPREMKLKAGAVLITKGIQLADSDRKKAASDKILVLDYEALMYYSRLSKIIGSASRYQLFAEIFATQEIEGLRVKVPAVESRMGEHTVYHFAVTPDLLLKLSYVAHRARNNIGSYQRMVQPRRLARIREYIDDGGVFPTNIVINFTRSPGKSTGLLFEPSAREADMSSDSRLGVLALPAKYQSAWVIDGQHRLLAYSDHKWASKSTLTVTAFNGLDAGTQAELFVRINSEQKKVPASHLEALFATLNWDSDDPKQQVRAIISQAIQNMRADSGSIFADRILLPDEDKTDLRCVTLKSLADALKRPGLFIKSETNGVVRQFGILWFGEPEQTLHRVTTVLESYFRTVSEQCVDQWNLGDAAGGLVATNRGISASIRILAEILETIRKSDVNAPDLSADELNEWVKVYSVAVGEFFANLTEIDISTLRQHYGAGAPSELAFRIAEGLEQRGLSIGYPDLDKWRSDKESTNAAETKRIVDDLEKRVKNHLVETLKAAYGENGWWKQVPPKIRADAASRREFEGEDHPNESYLMLVDYREIAQAHWTLFDGSLGIPKQGNKDARTKWVVRWNEVRNKSFHGSGARLKPEDYRDIKDISDQLQANGV